MTGTDADKMTPAASVAVEAGSMSGTDADEMRPPASLVCGVDLDECVNAGVCNFLNCSESVFIACPTCFVFLCHDHCDSDCCEHNVTDCVPCGAVEYVIVVEGETGNEYRLPVYSDVGTGNGTLFECVANDNIVNDSLDDLNVNTTCHNENVTDGKSKLRRKTANPKLWQRNVEKSNHLRGCQYQTARGTKDAKSVRPRNPQACDCSKCRYHCSENFSAETRDQICQEFYGMADYSRQKDFIVNNVIEVPTKQVTKSAGKHRQVAHTFYLTSAGVRRRVCGNFFCKTLDIQIRSVQKYFEVHRGAIGLGSVADGRGRHRPPNKTPDWARNLIKKHIESFPCMESHYCRASSSRKYLDAKLTIVKMYETFGQFFKEHLSNADGNEAGDVHMPSEKVYRDIFCTEYNLAFYVPRKDQCSTCAGKNSYIGNVEKLGMFESHIRQKDRAQKEKKSDKLKCANDDTFKMATFDMQSVLQIPTSEVGPLYYKRKLVLHNFTIYDSDKPNKAFCYLWPETEGNRGANEIGTCVFRYLKSLDPKIKHVTFFSDSCSGQNRNQYVCSLLLYAVAILPIDIIDHKFLIPGHTMMECDSMHSQSNMLREILLFTLFMNG
jgi:hypothetical protein